MRTHVCPLIVAWALCAGPGPAQEVVGKPCLFNDYFAEWRSFPAVLRDPEGNLTCGRHRLNRGGATQGPPAAGDPVATAGGRPDRPGPRCHFTYRDPEGQLQDLWYERSRERDRWHVETLTGGGRTWGPPAAGDPSAAQDRGAFHVVYRDAAGGIQDLWQEEGWHLRQLNLGVATDAPAAAGDPVQLVRDDARQVLYRDREGALQELTAGATWSVTRLTAGGATDAPPAVGKPAAAQIQGASHVIYRDADGGLHELRHRETWQATRLNGGGATGAPPAAGDPCVWVAEGAVLHVAYRDAAGVLHDLWRDGAWRSRALNLGGATGAPAAAGDPAALVPLSNWEYLGYVDVQGRAQLLSRFLDNPWQAAGLGFNGQGERLR